MLVTSMSLLGIFFRDYLYLTFSIFVSIVSNIHTHKMMTKQTYYSKAIGFLSLVLLSLSVIYEHIYKYLINVF